jgi:hypothetical protein
MTELARDPHTQLEKRTETRSVLDLRSDRTKPSQICVSLIRVPLIRIRIGASPIRIGGRIERVVRFTYRNNQTPKEGKGRRYDGDGVFLRVVTFKFC